MSNKTCGECKHCTRDDFGIECCDKHGICNISEKRKPCFAFEPIEPKQPTNGDKIRQMSNEELASFISVHTICSNCPARTEECLHNASKVCKRKWLNWLNAPAESEANNG